MKIIYHGGCLDGFTSAWLLSLKFPDAEFLPYKYGMPLPTINDGEDVIIADFSFLRDETIALAEKAGTITILDHHQTAMDHLYDLPANVEVVFDNERSGAGIVWDHYWIGPRPPLVDYVEDNDLWRHVLPNTYEISAYIKATEMTFKDWQTLAYIVLDFPDTAIENGESIIARQNQIKKEIIATHRIFDIDGFRVKGVASPYSLGSEVAGELAEGYPFGLYYIDYPDRREFGLRSGEFGIDVAKLAEKFGGGGHKHAAGFRVPKDHYLAKM